MPRARGDAEQLRVELLAVAGRAVDRDERAVARRLLQRVNRARRHLTAGAFLAADQHAGAHAGGARDQRHHVAHRQRVAVQIVAVLERRRNALARLVFQLALDRVGDAPPAERPREHVRHPRQHRLRRQVGTPRVDDGEHERGGALGADLARDLERGGAARQIQQHRHVAPLQLGQRERRVLGPHHGDVRGAELLLRVRALWAGQPK